MIVGCSELANGGTASYLASLCLLQLSLVAGFPSRRKPNIFCLFLFYFYFFKMCLIDMLLVNPSSLCSLHWDAIFTKYIAMH